MSRSRDNDPGGDTHLDRHFLSLFFIFGGLWLGGRSHEGVKLFDDRAEFAGTAQRTFTAARP